MILAIDIGNTTVTLGGVRIAPQQAYSLEFTARIDINHTWSASQYESAIEQLFEDKNLSPSDFRGVIISSVVPSVLTLLQECVRNLFGTEPLLVTSESDLGMTFSIPEPEKVGRDRLVDAAWTPPITSSISMIPRTCFPARRSRPWHSITPTGTRGTTAWWRW